MWVLPVVVLGAATIISVEVAGSNRADEPTQLRFPRAPGTLWVYSTYTDGKPTGFERVQVLDRTVLLAQPVDVIESRFENFEGTGPYASVTYESRAGRRVLSHGVRDRSGSRPEEPGSPVFIEGATPGQTTTWRGKQGDEDSTLILTRVGIETITVSGRTYRGCAHDRSTRRTGRATITAESWHCPGVGAVHTIATYVSPTLTLRLQRALVALVSPMRSFRTATAPADLTGGAGNRGTPEAQPVDPGSQRLDLSRYRWTDRRREGTEFAPVGNGQLIVTTDERGGVRALDTTTGERAWQVRLTPPIVVQPVIADQVVLVSDGAKSLMALDLSTGAPRWIATFPDVLSAPPVVGGGVVVVALENRSLRGLRLSTGAHVWRHSTADRVTHRMATDSARVVVVDVSGGLSALRLEDGATAWEFALDGRPGAGPAISESTVLVADGAGYLRGLAADSGQQLWDEYRAGTVTTEPAVGGGLAVFVFDEARVEALDVRTGQRRWRQGRDVVGRVVVPPVVVGDTVVLLAHDGALRPLDLGGGIPRPRHALGSIEPSIPTYGVIPLAGLGGTLVVTLVHGASRGATMLGFPVTSAEKARAGVRIAGQDLTLPAAVFGAPSGTPDRFVYAGLGGSVWAVTGGRSRELLKGGSPFAVSVGQRAFYRRDADLVAADRTSGKQVWTVATGPSGVPPTPLPDGRSVAAGVSGPALAVYDADSGTQRWRVPVSVSEDLVGATGPLALPGGDVVYAVGALGRYSGADGRVVWRSGQMVSIASPAADDRAVYVAGLAGDTTVLRAVDLATGRPLWQVPVDIAFNQGPVVGGETVTIIDHSGDLRAFDRRTGKVLWARALHSEGDGPPAIIGDVVVVAAKGHVESGRQDRHRVIAYALDDGRFLGARDVFGQDFGRTGFARLGDRLFVPSYFLGPGAVLLTIESR